MVVHGEQDRDTIGVPIEAGINELDRLHRGTPLSEKGTQLTKDPVAPIGSADCRRPLLV
jgi:hypothetical protein